MDNTQSHAERRAWRILITFFTLFLIVCGSGVWLVQWYIFRSMIELDTDLKVARGTVSIVLPNTQEAIAVTDQRADLGVGAVIQTDEKSQAILSFADPNSGQPVASLVVFPDSSVIITQSKAPRFGVNGSPYQIETSNSLGQSEMAILQNSGRSTYFEVTSPQAVITMAESGLYSIEHTDQRTWVTVHAGKASVSNRDTGENIDITDNDRLMIDASNGQSVSMLDDEPLVANSDFSQDFQSDWEAYSIDQPAGSVQNAVFDGRSVVVLDRSQANWPDQTLGHGELGLAQMVNTNVNDYSSIELRMTFYVAEQSLALCGEKGSECPIMIRITYIDVSGTEQVYIHGFYAQPDNSQTYPLLCDTCRSEHERINLGSWYTFSKNLLVLLPAEQRPTHINEMRFYASGWAFKVYVSEMSLVGAQSPPTLQ